MLTMEILGGMHSVVLTDIVQAIIMLFGFAMLAIVMITQYGVLDLDNCEMVEQMFSMDACGMWTDSLSPQMDCLFHGHSKRRFAMLKGQQKRGQTPNKHPSYLEH